jgi:hypothetical protein
LPPSDCRSVIAELKRKFTPLGNILPSGGATNAWRSRKEWAFAAVTKACVHKRSNARPLNLNAFFPRLQTRALIFADYRASFFAAHVIPRAIGAPV